MGSFEQYSSRENGMPPMVLSTASPGTVVRALFFEAM